MYEIANAAEHRSTEVRVISQDPDPFPVRSGAAPEPSLLIVVRIGAGTEVAHHEICGRRIVVARHVHPARHNTGRGRRPQGLAHFDIPDQPLYLIVGPDIVFPCAEFKLDLAPQIDRVRHGQIHVGIDGEGFPVSILIANPVVVPVEHIRHAVPVQVGSHIVRVVVHE